MQGGNEDLTKWYDFHARQYDAALGRWFGVDALGYKMPGMSPYNAMANNPVMFVDPDGNEPITIALGLVLLKKMAVGAAFGAGISAALYSATTAITDQSWNWRQFGKSMAIGAVSGVVTAGAGVLTSSMMKSVYGAVPGALVKGGISAAGSGLAGGLSNVMMEGNWNAFGSGFTKGALVGGLMGGFSGGVEGFKNAKNSIFERNKIFGYLTQTGREEVFKSFVLKHELFQSGMINYSFENLDNAYGVTKAISPETGETISIAKAARQYPNGVNSEYTFNSKKLVSLRKIEANVIHEKQHIIDLHTGKVNEIFRKATSTEGFRAMLEIRAHQAALDAGFQMSYNLGRIGYWSNFLK